MTDDTIAAVSTAFGQGAIAVIRVSGARAVDVVGSVFSGRVALADADARMANFGEIRDGEAAVDQVLATVFRAPASYTGEDLVEVGCHGGVLVTQRVYELLLAAGARPAEAGEFTQRAFLNGKMDLTQAEAVMDLIEAQTSLALRAANRQLEGKLGSAISDLREEMIGIIAHVEAYIDFPEEDIDPDTGDAMLGRLDRVVGALEKLLATSEQGRILREGVRTVICGEPNVGKSSLLNCLLGFDRAIVSDVAGTTRDTIEEVVNLRGIPLRLVDTAGVRESSDAIEAEGIGRAERQIEDADLVIEVVDGSVPPGARMAIREGARHILVRNKSDLGNDVAWGDGVQVSCLQDGGIEPLADVIFEKIAGGDDWVPDAVAINARHKSCLLRAKQGVDAGAAGLRAGQGIELVALELRSALEAIGEVVGKVDVEELLGEIFSSFCIGK